MTKWAAKAAATGTHLRRLNNTQRGSHPDLIIQAVKACIISTALYGAEVWWPGDTVLSWKRGKYRELKHRSGQLVTCLSRAIHVGLRAILPVYKTTPLPILYREAGIPPVTLILQEIRLRQALRIQTLEEPHPLKRRAYGKLMTRLTETAKLLPRSVDSENIMLNSAVHTATSEINSSIHDIHLFTDGARNPDGKARGGYVLYQAGQRVLT